MATKVEWEVEVITRPCIICDRGGSVTVPFTGWQRWQTEQVLVQDAFPFLAAELREQLINGTHPACWDEMFGGGDAA